MNYSYLSIVSMNNIVYIVTNATGSQMESPPSSKWTLLLTGITTTDQTKLNNITNDSVETTNLNIGYKVPNIGERNTVIGKCARLGATAGYNNTIVGMSAGFAANGIGNTIFGHGAGSGANGNYNVYLGYESNPTNYAESYQFKVACNGYNLMTGNIFTGKLDVKGDITSNGISVATLRDDVDGMLTNWTTFIDDFDGITINNAWFQNVTSSGATFMLNAVGEPSSLIYTGGAGQSSLGFNLCSTYSMKNRGLSMEFRTAAVCTGSASMYVGLSNEDGSQVFLLTLAADGMWKIKNSPPSGVVLPYPSTSITNVANQYNYWKIVTSNTDVKLYGRTSHKVDWSLLYSTTTNDFTNALYWTPFFSVNTTTGKLYIDYVKVSQDRENIV